MSEPFDRWDEATMDAVGRVLPRVTPPDDLFERIAAATGQGAPPSATVVPLPVRSRARRLATTLAAATLAAAAAVAVTVTLESGGGLGAPSASAPVTAHLASAHLVGRADLYRPERPNGVLRLLLRDVPDPARGTHYEVWVLPRGSTTMTAVGSFTPARRAVTLSLPLPGAGSYAAVDISIQQNNGSPEHSGTSLAGASFPAAS